MSISIPILALGPVYRNFEEAQPGTLLMLNTQIATGRGQDWNQWDGSFTALRVETEAGPALLVIEPKHVLVFTRAIARAAISHFETVAIAAGAALDVGKSLQLAISPIEPKAIGLGAQLAAGEVAIEVDGDKKRLLVAVNFPSYANRMAIIKGEGAGTVVDIGQKQLITLGKLAVEAIPVSA